MTTSSLSSGVGKLACLAVLAGPLFCLWHPSAAAAAEREISGFHRVYRRRLIKRPLIDDDVGFRKMEKNLSAHMVSISEDRGYFAHIDFPGGKELLASAWDITTTKPRNATTTIKGNATSKELPGAVSASSFSAIASTKVPGTVLSDARKQRSRRRRRHAAVDNMEETEIEELTKRRDRSPDERKRIRKHHRKKRLREADGGQGHALLDSNSELDRYFRKEKTNDFFENLDEAKASADNNVDDEIESVYARAGD